jgi:glycosyltransferase involved in cell wall biosynthesis
LDKLPRSANVISILHNHQESIYQTGLAGVANLNAVVCVGTRILNEARQRGATAGQAVHIPYGVDVPAEWSHDRLNRLSGPLRVLFMGRIEHGQKGVLNLPLIAKEAIRLGAAMTLDVVGAGPHLEQLKAAFAAQPNQLPVTFHGRMEHAKALARLDDFDVLLMPSRFEGFPIALIEAMAHGVVPVASRLPGITDDAVMDGVNGLLPAVDDITGFARALVTLQDHDARLRMSRAAWQVASEKFKMGIMAERYVSLLKRGVHRHLTPADDTQTIGAKLFGAAWHLPVALVGFARALRRGRLGSVLKRKIESRLSKAM